jgi:hypothetical protein
MSAALLEFGLESVEALGEDVNSDGCTMVASLFEQVDGNVVPFDDRIISGGHLRGKLESKFLFVKLDGFAEIGNRKLRGDSRQLHHSSSSMRGGGMFIACECNFGASGPDLAIPKRGDAIAPRLGASDSQGRCVTVQLRRP